MDYISLAHLKGACLKKRELFTKLFPKGAPVDEWVALYAVNEGLRVHWLEWLLPSDARIAFRKITKPYWRTYYDAEERAWIAYKKEIECSATWLEYKEITTSAQQTYNKSLADSGGETLALAIIPFLKDL